MKIAIIREALEAIHRSNSSGPVRMHRKIKLAGWSPSARSLRSLAQGKFV